MISAFAVAGQVLDEPSYTRGRRGGGGLRAARVAPDGRLLRTWREGRAKQEAFSTTTLS